MKWFDRIAANWHQIRGLGLLKRAAKADPKKAPFFYRAAFERFAAAIARCPDYFAARLNWGHGLYNLGRTQTVKEQWKTFHGACEQYEHAHLLDPEDFDALKFWGLSWRALARNNHEKDPERCYRLAYEKLEKAASIQLKNNDALYHWAFTLYEQARKKKPEKARPLLREACAVYAKAAARQADQAHIFNDWAVTLLALANQSEGEEKRTLISEAHSKCLEAERFKAGSASYNLACIASLSDDPENCRRYLESAFKALKIPSAGHLENDQDFKTVRNTDWFKELTAKVRDNA
ncbi:MAG: TPR end-of-group domain-containing protein [Gammaproteobacteria bacterium]